MRAPPHAPAAAAPSPSPSPRRRPSGPPESRPGARTAAAGLPSKWRRGWGASRRPWRRRRPDPGLGRRRRGGRGGGGDGADEAAAATGRTRRRWRRPTGRRRRWRRWRQDGGGAGSRDRAGPAARNVTGSGNLLAGSGAPQSGSVLSGMGGRIPSVKAATGQHADDSVQPGVEAGKKETGGCVGAALAAGPA
uniref:Uncharacterized protein n=1 Tax=Oryza glumipatula TaxID=40148 RepID=A0A0D9ZSC4_9ORYZ